MPDTKVSDLSTLTGANLATGDEFPFVDISDSTMAASGTDKSITADELAKGMATNLGVVGRDKLWDAAGDIALGTGADTAARLAVSTAAGAALVADPNATNKVSWQYPHGVNGATRGTSGSLASSYDRYTVNTANVAAFTSATLMLFGIQLPKGLTVTSITFWSGTTALASGNNQWFGLFDSSRNQLRLTSDDTSTAWASNTAKTLTLTSTYTTTTAGWFYVGYMVKASTMPTFLGLGSLDTSAVTSATPIPRGAADAGLTNPASCPSQAAALAAVAKAPYFELS